jgi:hypothetical protein
MTSVDHDLTSRSSSEATAPRLAEFTQPGSEPASAHDQPIEGFHEQAVSGEYLLSGLSENITNKISALALTYHQPNYTPLRGASVAGFQASDTATPQKATTTVPHVASTEGTPPLRPAVITTAKRRAPCSASTPSKNQKVDSSNASKKRRMKGKKGVNDGFIPKWESPTPYSLTTLRNKIGNTKIAKYLTEQGIDVAIEFPTIHMVFKGETMTRGDAMAMKAQELQQANIDQKIADGHVPAKAGKPARGALHSILPNRNSRTGAPTADKDDGGSERQNDPGHAWSGNGDEGLLHQSETDHSKNKNRDGAMGDVGLSSTHKNDGYDSELDGVCESDDDDNDDRIRAKSEPTVVSYIRTALRTIKKVALKSGYTPAHPVLDGLKQPLISGPAQAIISRMVAWENQSKVFRREAGDGAPNLRDLLFNDKRREDHDADHQKLVYELVQAILPASGVKDVATALVMAHKLVDEEFGVET